MKKRIVIWGVLLLAVFTVSFFYSSFPWKIHADTKTQEKSILSLVQPFIVYAEITKDTNQYKSPDKTSTSGDYFYKGAQVEILQDRTEKWYEVMDTVTGQRGWISGDALFIPEDTPSDKSQMSKEDMEYYMDFIDLKSETKYAVWVDIKRQKVNVFEKDDKHWKMVKSIVCATGRNHSPTTRGLYQLTDRGEWFYSERLGSGAKYWVRFNDTYLFHSVAMDRQQNVIDGVLGERRSGGCVRMSVEDAKWFYETIPDLTAIFIN